jgi:cyclic pyranopterin phosphate synthase
LIVGASVTKFSHMDDEGRAAMVDVGAKKPTARRARAEGEVRFGEPAFRALQENRLAKGDAMAVARLAGIQASKRTQEWIPLCHAVPLDWVSVDVELLEARLSARVTVEVRARWYTGVEMEALVAVSAACLALYDMAKAVDRGITIDGVRLLEKEGGRSGKWTRK